MGSLNNLSEETDNESVNSSDEALMEMLGISSLSCVSTTNDESEGENIHRKNQHHDETKEESSSKNNTTHSSEIVFEHMSQQDIESRITDVIEEYEKDGICVFPLSTYISIEASYMRKLCNELVFWSSPTVTIPLDSQQKQLKKEIDKTYETILGERMLTRMENFVNAHSEWYKLSTQIGNLLSIFFKEEYVLFKEKLNLKPPGGKGFAPHLDTPSLRVAFGNEGPSTFLTVMISIDDMNSKNGCLKVVRASDYFDQERQFKGRCYIQEQQQQKWCESNHVPVIHPKGTNPDGDGRAGAIKDISGLDFKDVIIKGGQISIFNGFVPHSSDYNHSLFPRRAVFLTYNPKREGDFHDLYYEKMTKIRNEWKVNSGFQAYQDKMNDLKGLDTIPNKT